MTVHYATTAAPAAPATAAQRAEAAFARLHGADAALLLPSAVTATTAVLLALSNPGGHIIVSDQTCDPLRAALDAELTGSRRTVTFVDCTEVDAVVAAVRPATQVVYTPSLSDPLMRLAPLGDLATYAQMNDLLLVVDNTALSPAEVRPLETGAVVVIEDSSPCLDEWGDVSAAFVTGAGRHLAPVREQAARFGGQVDPWAAHLLERSLSTLGLRLAARRHNAERVADALRGHRAVHAVHRPSFDDAPWALETHDGFGGLLAFEVAPEVHDLGAVLDACAGDAGDGGATASTLRLPALTTHAHLSERVRQEGGISRQLVRASIGTQDPAPLIRGLRRALDAAAEPRPRPRTGGERC
ncbi:PLP-dependent transferase [Streptomyces sp. NPDC006632]|uniref:PLP-dependent transferase n=1 Tax=unclassified Streptomyces TaxID=2593676 RepID=UPI002E1AA56E